MRIRTSYTFRQDIMSAEDSINSQSKLLGGVTSSEEREKLGSAFFFWRRRRHVVAVLAFLGFVNLYTARVNLSVAIIIMTAPRAGGSLDNSTTSAGVAEFDWDTRTQGWLLSSFFYGYLVSQVPSGFLAYRVGGCQLFGISIGVSSILSLLTPIAARMGVPVLLTLRVFLGLFGGMSMPSMNTVWMRWAPPMERCRLATLAASGINLGTVLVFFLAGSIVNHLGWQGIFYLFGILGVIWFLAWLTVVYQGPELDPQISPEELEYIQSRLGSFSLMRKRVNYPWSSIVRSSPFLALAAAHFSNNWGFYTFLTQLPSYLNDTHKLDVHSIGILASLPYILLLVFMQVAGQLSDRLVQEKILTVSQTRKVLLCTTMVAQSILLVVLVHLNSIVWVMVTVVIVIAITAFAKATILVNHLDMAPLHAGVLMGVTNSLATLPGIISPVLSGYIVRNKSAAEWNVVFYIMVFLYLIGAILYAMFASGELQQWSCEGQHGWPL